MKFKDTGEMLKRIFTIVEPNCPYRQGIKTGSKECKQCDHFRGGIVENFVDCSFEGIPAKPKDEKQGRKLTKKSDIPKKAAKKPVNKRKSKK